MLETTVFRDQNAIDRPDGTTLYKKSTDLADRKGSYARTKEEEKLRTWGLRSQREALSSDVNYKIDAMEKQAKDRTKSLTDKYYDAIRRGDTERAKEVQQLYIDINGTEIKDEAVETQMMEEYTTTFERKTSTAGEKIRALKGIARIKKIMESHDNNERTTP